MKIVNYPVLSLLCLSALFCGCSKGGGYSAADHTVGMVNTARTWSGYAYGYVAGDTLIPPATTNVTWTLSFNRTITDTSFEIQKVNGFEIGVIGTDMNYISTDSLTGKVVKYDTTLASGAAISICNYYYANDSIYVEIHQLGALNTLSHKYYQNNIYLHTN